MMSKTIFVMFKGYEIIAVSKFPHKLRYDNITDTLDWVSSETFNFRLD